jgi:hypothetical protein
MSVSWNGDTTFGTVSFTSAGNACSSCSSMFITSWMPTNSEPFFLSTDDKWSTM